MDNRPGLKTALLLLKIVVSVSLLAWLLRRADMGAMAEQFRRMSYVWMAVALATYGLMVAVSAWRWRLLLQLQRVDVRLRTLGQSFLVATFFNNFLPSNIGGDVVRIADTAPFTRSKTVATTVVLLDRTLGLLALLILAAVAATVAMAAGVPLRGIEYIWAALLVVTPLLLVLLRWPGLLSRVAGPLVRHEALAVRFGRLLETIERFGRQPRGIWIAFGGAVLVQVLLIAFFICAARSLAIPFPLMAAAVIVPVSLAVQMVPISINGFGVREAVFAFFFRSLGLDVSAALTLSLGSAALIMLFSLSGGLLFVLRRRRTEAAMVGVSASNAK